MSAWFAANGWRLLCVAAALILLAGCKPLVKRVGEHKVLLWFAFLLYVAVGLVLGAGLFAFARWVTSLSGTFGGLVASVGAVLAVIGGWWSFLLVSRGMRDVADGQPDDDARKAALWIPTLGPACFQAAWSIARHPHGIGTGLTAAIIAVISLLFLHRIIRSVLTAQKHTLFWKWFAVGMSLLAGFLMIPLLGYLDTLVARHASGDVVNDFRVVVGMTGFALLIACIADAWPKKDKGEKRIVPDGYVRAFAALGVPALALCGTLAFGFASEHAQQQTSTVVGSAK